MGTNNADNAALDRLLDSSDNAVKARATDGRGLAFWAWEFQSEYALGSILANGGDILSESKDVQGQTAVEMCTQNPECNKDDLIKKAKSLVSYIKTRKEA